MEGSGCPRGWHGAYLVLTVGYDRGALAAPVWLRLEEFDGFAVRYRLPTVDALQAVVDIDDFAPVTALTVEEVARCRPLVHHFAGLLVDWTMEENGRPVPASGAAFLALDGLFQMQVAMTWARVTAGFPQSVPVLEVDVVNLDEPEFDESTLPMETLAS